MRNNIQLCFTGGCGYYPYMCGIAHYIKEHYKLDNAIFSGASSGCWPALLLSMDCNIKNLFIKMVTPLLSDLKNNKLAPFKVWNDYVRKHTNEVLDKDIHYIANNTLYISLTNVNNVLKPRNELVNKWTSKEDLIECIIASTFIPIFDNKLRYEYKNNKYIDGGATNNCPLPLGKNTKHIIISHKLWSKLPKRDWIPSLNINIVSNLFELGYQEAKNNSNFFSELTPKNK